MTARDYWKGKRIAVIGLDPHGEMVEDVKYLIKAGALVSVYDLKSEARLKKHLVFLRTIGLANYVCSSIPADDLLDMDLIVLSHEYPRDSSFLKAAEEKGIQIEYPETLFFKLAPPVTVVGIMGAVGKATVLSMLVPLMEVACEAIEGQGLHIIDPESGDGIISVLKKAKSGDIVLVRIVESLMKELVDMRISPHVAIFTTVPSKGSYTESPFEILQYQTYNNFIIGSDEIIDATHSLRVQPKAKMLRTKPTIIPFDWTVAGQLDAIRGHDKDNAALALQAAKLFKVSDEDAERIIKSWKPLKGRLELIKKVKEVEFYNDSASISPTSTISAVKSLSRSDAKSVILVFGGVESGGDYSYLYSMLPELVRSVILVPGSGTMKERCILQKLEDDKKLEICSAASLEDSARIALESAKKGDRVVFSPGFEAGGMDGSRKERGERFVKAVRAL